LSGCFELSTKAKEGYKKDEQKEEEVSQQKQKPSHDIETSSLGDL